MKIAYLTNASAESGVGYYGAGLKNALSQETSILISEYKIKGESGVLLKDSKEVSRLRTWPGPFSRKSVGWIRLGRVLRRELAREQFDLVHATNQTLSFVPKGKVPFVVTVHDLIEVLEPQQFVSSMLAGYLYGGISRARHVIAVSKYTAETVMQHGGVSKERITIIPNGVGPEFHQTPHFANTIGYQTLRRELKLKDAHPTVLYVGSDHPRKNVLIALEVFAKVKKERPDAVFIKVGAPGIASGREQLLAVIDKWGLRSAVRIVNNVSIERLNELYNIADVLLYPSRFEGFGLPPLQAMAAALPVVCSNATSLPEVVGDAALTRSPDDVEGFATDVLRVVGDKTFSDNLRTAGMQRAKQFSWGAAAQKTIEVYKKVLV